MPEPRISHIWVGELWSVSVRAFGTCLSVSVSFRLALEAKTTRPKWPRNEKKLASSTMRERPKKTEQVVAHLSIIVKHFSDVLFVVFLYFPGCCGLRASRVDPTTQERPLNGHEHA